MEMIVKGYGDIEYSFDELKRLCPKCHTKKEIEADATLKAELERRKEYHSKIYNNKSSSGFPDEKWIPLSDIKGFEKYSVSNKGRVKFNGEFLSQDDEDGKYGYLVLDPEHTKRVAHSVYVYTLVAYAFLDKKPGDGKHVHHIDNNGYDCRPENLILLDAKQHSYVHGFSCEKYNDEPKSECL